MTLTANQLSLISTNAQCSSSTEIAAIKVAMTSSTDRLVNCPLILAYGQFNTTLVTLAVNYSSNKTISLVYQLL